MNAVYQVTYSSYRQGALHGLYVADSGEMDNFIQRNPLLNFGEVLGKHSALQTYVNEWDIRKIEDQECVDMTLKWGLSTGYNLLEYEECSDSESECQESECEENDYE